MSLHRLSATDGVWLSLESPDMPMHVAFLMEFTAPDGDADRFVRRWLAQVAAPAELPRPWNLVPVSRLASLVREVDEVNLGEHIRTWELPQPGGHEQLLELATRIHQQQLDLRRPPWEIHLVQGLGADRFALILKVHHSLFDGASLMRLFTDTFSTDPDDRETPHLFTVGRANDAPPQRTSSNPLRVVLVALRGVLEVLRGIGGAGRDALRRARGRRTAAQRAYEQPPSIFDGPITGRRDLSTRRYDLALFKRLAKAGECTINDIVLYLVSTALRGYLDAHGHLPARTLTAGVPMDLREQDDDRLGTRAGMMFTALATDIADPRERLTAVKRSIDAAKRHMTGLSPNAAIGYGLAVTLPWILGLNVGFDRMPSSHPMGVSNVPGPRRPLYWNGARLEALYPISLLMHGNSFNVTCVGYTDALHFGILGAADKLPPLTEFTHALDTALDELTTLLLPEEHSMPSAG
ncbi:wax ester/triacylglycerol synthase family O-acyltransferase [Nocardia transvalensis]|uniref:wax ester/triacylglycerol synthase family O-acyltransferase n=1 Tax=Nocardia transvalensis TaxID=37333 RepID=UPI0018950462|nr:wax ester/triacylglycerol synthase family O-acyltransferase [Nocardia transvalensis]MBF6330780.1 wax ester/triacylglycerol synthase family O-acyltransferase [Nocardia transvalensis]